MPGRAHSITPNAMVTSPPRMNTALVPAGSPDWRAAKNSTRPAMTAHTPTTKTRTSAVGPGHTSATIPAARSTRPSSRCPMTGPALRLVNPRAASMAEAMNA